MYVVVWYTVEVVYWVDDRLAGALESNVLLVSLLVTALALDDGSVLLLHDGLEGPSPCAL